MALLCAVQSSRVSGAPLPEDIVLCRQSEQSVANGEVSCLRHVGAGVQSEVELVFQIPGECPSLCTLLHVQEG